MQHPILFSMGIFFFALAGATESALAQTAKNADGYPMIEFEDLQSTTLKDLAPEVGGGITSYSVTIACERKDLYDLTCTGDSLNSAFFDYLSKTDAKSCLCYFDKIIADGKLVKGFVIEVQK